MSEIALFDEGVKVLRETLRIENTEHFDYTKWRKNLYKDTSIEELAKKAQRVVS